MLLLLNALGWIGAGVMLYGYAMVSTSRMAGDGMPYQVLNLVGSIALMINSAYHGERPAHTLLLGAGIPIVEHMTGPAALPDTGFRFHAAPPMVVGMGTFPVRAYAVVDG
ncbi:kynurenine formamidase [Streptosporangium album]|uniref:Kynurenine formamidase n=1 Tax=Streptosporangium album TaxID=47479 RepID=A0A7W7S077_9ACTN|nr:hypothetical protein [Streptosporangium album]MBB4941137.1 kynurenine formamidase [Streptosporangium album]